ncbi:MAG: glycosyltransferase family 1 protein, partial [Acidobacteria bacterium]|nr:glycosyltransferase family 1 protein [Acidobacteriota bacterium]
AQHRLTGPPGIAAAREAGVPAICTVRDYWPVCYWSDLIHDPRAAELCPSCTAGMMTRCVRPRAGALWPLTLPLIPYMRANLRRKQRALANADAVVAVGSAMARDLRE